MPLDRRSAVLLRTVYTVTVIGIFLYFLMWQVNFYLAESIKQGIYLFFPPVLLAGVLYFRKLKDGIEIKLVAAYLLWVVITRIINGDRVLSKEYLFVLDLSLMLPFMSLGLVLDRAGRRRVLNWLSVILGVYFFMLGVLCIYTYITSRDLINPITGGYLTAVFHKSKGVITALDTNPNTIAFWFMMPFLLMLYQLFSSKSKSTYTVQKHSGGVVHLLGNSRRNISRGEASCQQVGSCAVDSVCLCFFVCSVLYVLSWNIHARRQNAAI